MHPLLKILISCALLWPAAVVIAQDQAPACLSEEQLLDFPDTQELILQAYLPRRRYVLSDATLAFRHADVVYLPLQDTTFALELTLPSAEQLAKLGCLIAPSEAYLAQHQLESIFDLSADVNLSRMRSSFETTGTFPVEARLDREKKWARGPRARQLAVNPAAPFIASPYRWLEWPSAYLSAFTTFNDKKSAPEARYNTQWAGDLLGMSSEFLVLGNSEDGLSTVRGTLSRFDPSAGLLGPLHARRLQLGDVTGINDSLVSRGNSGRGISISNLRGAQSGNFDTTALAGLLPQGWTVELLRNGELLAVDSDSADGRYEFLDVPLLYGNNEFILNFFGPAGEQRSERVVESITQNSLRAGETRYEFVANQTDTGLDGLDRRDPAGQRDLGDWLQTRVEHDWTRQLSQEFTYQHFRDADSSSQRQYLGTGFVAQLGRSLTRLRYISELEDGGSAWEAGIRSALYSTQIFASHAQLQDFDSERTRSGSNGSVTQRSQLRLSRAVPLPGRTALATLQFQQSETDRNISQRGLIGRISLPLMGWHISNETSYNSFSGRADSEFGINALRLRRQTGRWVVRADVQSRFAPESQFSSANINIDYRQSNQLRWRVGSRYSALSETYFHSVGGNYQNRRFSFGADLGCGNRQGCTAGINVAFSFSRNPVTQDWLVDKNPLNARGMVSVLGFEDTNADGVYNSDEQIVSGLNAQSRTARGLDDVTSSAAPHRLSTIRVSEDGIESPYLYAKIPEFNVLPRPGHHQVIHLPLVQTGEVEGTAFIQSASGARPLAGITIQAIDGDGVVIAQARSSYDGFFILSRLPLGQYRLEVALEDIKRLGLKVPAIPSINIGQAGDIASAGDLYVGKLTSHWTAPSIEPKAVQASQAPTNEFDETS